MKKIVLQITILLIISISRFTSSAQSNLHTYTDLLEIQWNLIENKYEGENQLLASFTIVNKSDKTLGANGWKVYFSYPKRELTAISGNVKMKNINGDFCSLEPDVNFKELKPSETLTIHYKANGKSYTFSDAPLGLYIVFNEQPEKGYPLKNYTINHIPAKEKEILKRSARSIFDNNRDIQDIPSTQLQPVLPSPVNYRKQAGNFSLTTKTRLVFHPDFENEARMLNKDMETILGKPLNKANTILNGYINLKKEKGFDREEYKLEITSKGITITASEPAGAFYAIQSLKLMIDPLAWQAKQKIISIANAQIQDKPRFGYRSFMLDVARNFQTKQQVFKILDLLALYKLNTLHFHLNDDEGWRLEIPSLPELTQVGSNRGHTLNDKEHLQPAYGSGPDTAVFPGSGHYSKQDFVEILRYARERHIKIIPELETPGHARAAIKSMDARYERLKQKGEPEQAKYYLLRDTLDTSVYRSVQGYTDNVMNVALPSVYNFIEKVMDEIIAMYKEADATLQTIHIGGDEVPAGVWTKSPAIAALMKSEKIETHDDLWYYYLNRVNKILKSKGLYLSGWEEVAMRKTKLDGKNRYIANPDFVNENFHTYVWNNVWGWGSEDLTYRLANAGYKVIMAPVTNFYFDLAYEKDADEPGLYWGSYLDTDKPFYLLPYDYYKTAKENPEGNPIDKTIFNNKERLTEFGKSNIVGLQCQIWSEKIKGTEQLEYMLLPKILGFAERAWSKAPMWETETDSAKSNSYYQQDWNWFVNLLGKRELPRLDYYSGGYNYRIPTVGIKQDHQGVTANVQLPGLTIRYTTDGTEPTIKSPLYKEGITQKGTINFKAFNTKGRGSRITSIVID